MAASAPLTPPSNSGTSWIVPGGFSSTSISGTSWIAATSPFTPPEKSGTSWTAASSPLMPPSKAGSSWTVPSPLTAPVNSGTSWISAFAPFLPPGTPAPSRLTGKLCMLSIAPSMISVISWPISSLLTAKSNVFVSYCVKKVAKFPFANLRTGGWFTNTSESNSRAMTFLLISTAFFTVAFVGAILSLLKKSQLNFL